MRDLFKHVRELNRREELWSHGDTLILGVSGGPDSLCLLDLMVRCAQKDELTLIVAHTNYGMRGKSSDNDERVVVDASVAHNLTYDVNHVDGGGASGSEALWREQRYVHFNALRKKYSAQKILLGHTANDQAETLLLHFLRGTGLTGLRGMQYCRENIVRPLLHIHKSEILSYCDEKKIAFCTDESNQDPSFTRNRIRNQLLPLLAKEYNPKIVAALQRAADHIADDYEYLETAASRCLPAEIAKESIKFSAHKYQNCHRALQYSRLRQFVGVLQRGQINIASSNIDELHKVLVSTKNKHHVVRMNGLKMVRKGDTVELTTEV